MTAAALNNVVIVMYQPQNIVNVAGVIRAMSNFGLTRLRLVEPAAWDRTSVLGIAHHTEALVDRVEHYATLEEAVADCGFVLGTTGRVREISRERLTPRQAALALLHHAAAAEAPVAILFGREQDGLPNSALDACHALLVIPTAPENRSLNLAQAMLLIAYELWLAANPDLPGSTASPLKAAPNAERPAVGAEPDFGTVLSALQADAAALAPGSYREGLFKALEGLLWSLYPGTTEDRMVQSMARLRAILLRAAPRRDEAKLLKHLFEHVTQRVKQSHNASS